MYIKWINTASFKIKNIFLILMELKQEWIHQSKTEQCMVAQTGLTVHIGKENTYLVSLRWQVLFGA